MDDTFLMIQSSLERRPGMDAVPQIELCASKSRCGLPVAIFQIRSARFDLIVSPNFSNVSECLKARQIWSRRFRVGDSTLSTSCPHRALERGDAIRTLRRTLFACDRLEVTVSAVPFSR